MKENLKITHSMTLIETAYYHCNKKNLEKIRKYDEIYSFNYEMWTPNFLMIKVRGKKTIYGYKIEDDGFYDIVEEKYYPNNSSIEIIDVKKEIGMTYSKKKGY